MSSWEEDDRASEALVEALERALGERIRGDVQFTRRVWGSLANVNWTHPLHGDATAGLTFREAGDVLADIQGRGDYMDWYMSSPDGVVDPEVSKALAVEGWRPL